MSASAWAGRAFRRHERGCRPIILFMVARLFSPLLAARQHTQRLLVSRSDAAQGLGDHNSQLRVVSF
jgi:hypothetical protein